MTEVGGTSPEKQAKNPDIMVRTVVESTGQVFSPSSEEKTKSYHEIDRQGPNWNVAEGVEGYEYSSEGYNYRIGISLMVIERPEGIPILETILSTPFTPDITRNLARIVITEDLLRNPPLELRNLLENDLESIIPLNRSGNRNLQDCYQVIFGRNAAEDTARGIPSRKTPPKVVEQELHGAAEAFRQAREIPLDRDRVEEIRRNYDFIRLSKESDPRLVESYRQLLVSTFGDDEDLDAYIADDTARVIVMVEKGDDIIKRTTVVGGAYAWRDTTNIVRNGKPAILTAYEIEGAVIRSADQGKHLYTPLSMSLLQELAQISDPQIDFIFGFSNASAVDMPVIRSAATVGRTLVTAVASELGYHAKPAEKQDIVNNAYVDDIVTFMQGEDLRKRYGS